MIESLYAPFQKWSDKGSVYLISDTHFGEKHQYGNAYDTISDDERIEIINAKVTKNDTLIHLGDVGDISYIPKIKVGHKVLILGNHDHGARYYQMRYSFIDTYETNEEALTAVKNKEINWITYDYQKPAYMGWKRNNLFDEVYEGPLVISKKIILSHEPIFIKGMLNIHGHDHSNFANMNKTEPLLGDQINICGNLTEFIPISLKEIIKSGRLNRFPSIHRIAIDNQKQRTLL